MTSGLFEGFWNRFLELICHNFRTEFSISVNKNRVCKAIASLAFADSDVQSNLRLQTKDFLSTSNSKQAKPQIFAET